MVRKNGLGKGLDSLIPSTGHKKAAPAKPEVKKEVVVEKVIKKEEVMVKITEVEPNREQPRKNFNEDALLELADSIKQFGIIQPLVVQKQDDYYEIIAGERRWRAAKLAGLKEVPVIIKNYTEQQIADSRWKVDYVLSHTCPLVYRPEKSLYTLSDPKSIDLSTERWLETLAANLQYERWYFGHYHDNRVYVDAEMLYDAIKLLGLKETLQKQGRPEYRKDEAVIFSTKINGMEVDGYGTIKQVHAYGTKMMDREVTYDIYGIKSGGAGAKELFENIAESQLMSAIL